MPPGPRLRWRRLGEPRAPPRPRHREERRGFLRPEDGHLGSADAESNEGLGEIHAFMKAQYEVEQFLYRQSELLDTKQWQKWIDLFTPDGIYWMPPDASYKTWDGQPAIFAEDKNLMTVRKPRVLHPDAWSQRPLWETNHVVSNVAIRKENKNGDIEVTSRFHMMELRRDDVRHFAGSYFHKLKKTKKGYAIQLQRVDMTNAQAAYDYVLQVWV